jgi:hypothetical protein
LEGRSLELIGWMRRRRRLELLLLLPDGGRAWIPAAWTDLEDAPGPQAAGRLGSAEDLLAMRRVLDGVLRAGLAGGSGVVLAGRDGPVCERRGDAIASGSGGVTGAGSGVVGAGGRRAAPQGGRAAGSADRTDGRRACGGGER